MEQVTQHPPIPADTLAILVQQDRDRRAAAAAAVKAAAPVDAKAHDATWKQSTCQRCGKPVTVRREVAYAEYQPVEDKYGGVCHLCLTDDEARDMNRMIAGALSLYHGRMFAEGRAKLEAALPPPKATAVPKRKAKAAQSPI